MISYLCYIVTVILCNINNCDFIPFFIWINILNCQAG